MATLPIFQSESRIPQTVGFLYYQDIFRFDNADLGVQLRYGGPDGPKADVYLYDMGRNDIPADTRSDVVKGFFEEAYHGVHYAAQQGMLLDLEVKACQYLHLIEGDEQPTYLWAAFSYKEAPGPNTDYTGTRYSHLALRTDKGYINKIRYTYPDTLDTEIANRAFTSFLWEWYEIIQGI